MSTMVRAGSTPEPSSAPARTVPVPRPAAVPVKRLSPALAASVSAKTPTSAASTLPSASTLTGWPFWPSTRLPSWSVSVPSAAALNGPLRV